MGLLFSSLVHSPDTGEIPAYLQRGCLLGADYVCYVFLGGGGRPGSSHAATTGEGRYYAGGGRGVASEPARFNDAKPYQLVVSDDAWAALKLRVDPLARRILDPHRSYFGAAFLCLLLTFVYHVVRPGGLNDRIFGNGGSAYPAQPDHSSSGGGGGAQAAGAEGEADDDWKNGRDDDGLDAFYSRQARDDDFYNNELTFDDDIYLAELEYHSAEMASKIKVWAAFYYLSLAVLLASTVAIATSMEARNAEVDARIGAVVEEMRPRFEGEGFKVEYRTRTETGGLFVGHIRPERVVVFRRLEGGDGGAAAGADATRSPGDKRSAPGTAPGRSPPRGGGGFGGAGAPRTPTRSPLGGGGGGHGHGNNLWGNTYSDVGCGGGGGGGGGGALMVTVPPNARPGQLVSVTTPTGSTVLVPVPRGARVGSVFPVLLPASSPPTRTSPGTSSVGDDDRGGYSHGHAHGFSGGGGGGRGPASRAGPPPSLAANYGEPPSLAVNYIEPPPSPRRGGGGGGRGGGGMGSRPWQSRGGGTRLRGSAPLYQGGGGRAISAATSTGGEESSDGGDGSSVSDAASALGCGAAGAGRRYYRRRDELDFAEPPAPAAPAPATGAGAGAGAAAASSRGRRGRRVPPAPRSPSAAAGTRGRSRGTRWRRGGGDPSEYEMV